MSTEKRHPKATLQLIIDGVQNLQNIEHKLKELESAHKEAVTIFNNMLNTLKK